MPVLKRQKGQNSVGELEEKITNGTASQKEKEDFRRFERIAQPLFALINKLERYGINLKDSPGVRVWRIKNRGDSASIAKLKWKGLNRKLEILLDLERQDRKTLPNEMLSEFALVEIPDNLPINKAPSFVYYKLANRLQKRLQESFKRKRNISAIHDSEMDYNDENYNALSEQGLAPVAKKSKKNKSSSYFLYYTYNNKEYMLIDDIAENLYLSSQTLRNWEKKGLVSFERIPYKALTGERKLRAIQTEKAPLFLDKLSKIKAEMNKLKKIEVPTGYLSTEEACRKLGICKRTLQRWTKAGKIPRPLKKQGRCFYKII